MTLHFEVQPDETAPRLVRFIARKGPELVGVAMVELPPAEPRAHLQAIVVEEAHRGRRLAQAILAALETALSAAGITEIEAWYDGNRADAPLIEHLARKMGWDPPFGLLLVRATGRVLEAPWMRIQPPPGDEIFPWSELTAEEAAVLGSADWYPEDLGPFPVQPVEPLNSLGVRRGGAVVGWMLNHRLDAQTIRYTRLFVHPDHRSQARGIALMVRSVRLQADAGVPFGYFGVRADNLPMRRFVERRMAPYLESIEESRAVIRRLTPRAP